jgi:glycosyltransferase involved in cell wall biosynthesis
VPKIIYIICPVYFDVKSFLLLREKVISLKLSTSKLNFIIVDDSASLDPEISDLKKYSDVNILTFPYNLGHQAALVAGLRSSISQFADDDFVITMDSDLEDNPSDIPKLIEMLHSKPHSVALAVRTQRKENIFFKLMYICFKILFKGLTGIHINNGNFACYSGSTIKRIIFHPYFNLCYSSTFRALKLTLSEVPCAREKRIIGKSHMNFTSLITHGFKMLMPFIDIISIRALCFFFSVLFVTLASLIFVTYLKFFTMLAIPGWTSSMLLSMVIILILSMTNFFIIFIMFSHSKSFQMNFLQAERNHH